ncbi:RNA-directed DNA polymerase [Alishewanella sp. BS5-314]|uniref:RNA-directed DNA polymerase n=1 Tax=Alishewanella sp. BS5-314 TaxID=2755587 RepID=UPI0021BA7353|nr:RNA-directed DNA polymerase [Alishewanella sp. BS5-314]
MSILFTDMGLAYRKAKVDLYYSSHPCLTSIAEYEENLEKNLLGLLFKIVGADESWIASPDFLGSWTLTAKSVNTEEWDKYCEDNGHGLIFSSPADEWDYLCEELTDKQSVKPPIAQFRVMAACSLDFHVLSTLWLLKIGHLFDAKLTKCAYGNRLRRTQDGKSINPLSLGSFTPYLKPFRDWRDNGIKAMHTALTEHKKIVALTADVSSFYHELNPNFMLNSDFLERVLNIYLDADQQKLHRLFINALKAWAQKSPLNKGLPVGLPASAVIANVALIELDRFVEQQVMPLYYGRYVDDILLVMQNGAGFRSSAEVWEWLFSRAFGKIAWADNTEKKEIAFSTDYLRDSKIRFANSKNKVFLLTGEPGKALVEAIKHQIYARASEWRAMPRIPLSAEYVGTDLLAATQSDGEAADNLRKADSLTMRRAGFAIKLRDFEAYERDLPPAAWQDHRKAFFRAFIDHVLVLPTFFDLSVYLPRVIKLATACEDFGALRRILDAVTAVCIQLNRSCSINIKASEDEKSLPDAEIVKIWRVQLFKSICENIAASIPPRLSKLGKQSWQSNMSNYRPSLDEETGLSWPTSEKVFQQLQARLFFFDLAHMPFRFVGLPKEMISQRGIPARKGVINYSTTHEFLPENIKKGVAELSSWIKFKAIPNGLIFATRPFNLPELFILDRNAYKPGGQDALRGVVLATRGFVLNEKTPCFDQKGVLQIPDGSSSEKYTIAVSSWKTNIPSWTAAVMRNSDPDEMRYARLNRLLDTVIGEPKQSSYLILPELSLPAHWFIRIARKLQGRGISLICGIEYLHAPKSLVRNQIWVSMTHDGLGFPSLMIYRQDKQRPALHEEHELQRLSGLSLKPALQWSEPPIIQHGDFCFALLVCSELTNIQYRAALRGKIDALFVPEWNQDTETFNALVESAALDIHAYIVQCNDRQYGDSRIRAPYKESWKRDILRVKGGITDYCVIGEIDVKAIRQFQSCHRSPSDPFKPVPDGFEISHNRKSLPK